MADKIVQDGKLVVTFEDDPGSPMEYLFSDIKGWQLWGQWLVIKYPTRRLLLAEHTIRDVQVVYNSDAVAKALADAHNEDDDPVATAYSCVSCHEKIRKFH